MQSRRLPRWCARHLANESGMPLTEQMIENVFKKGYAECLILRQASDSGSKGEAVGLALVSGALRLRYRSIGR